MIFWDLAPHEDYYDLEESDVDIPVVRRETGKISVGDVYEYRPYVDRPLLEKHWSRVTGWSLGPPSLLSMDLTGRRVIEFMMKPGDIILVIDIREDEVLGSMAEVLVRGSKGLICLGHDGTKSFREKQFQKVNFPNEVIECGNRATKKTR